MEDSSKEITKNAAEIEKKIKKYKTEGKNYGRR